ncbi:MAG: TIGR02597 family protein [Verrucomicrobiota bacterium JB024]|nr:TIGR02597 family protein [Verrucomicrobiota bacterium JB024]
MKTTTTLLAACSLLSAASLTSWADTAYTDPVMASSTTIAGNGGSGISFSVIGFPALSSIEATGVIDSIEGVDGDGYTTLVVTDVPSTWSTNNFDAQGGVVEFNFRNVPLYYVEITSGDKEGQLFEVLATGSGASASMTVGADLSGLDSAFSGATFAIRRKHTIGSVFGENNEAGFRPGQNDTEADLIYNLYGGVFETIYYQDDQIGIFGDGWRVTGDFFTDASDVCIDPDFGVFVAKRDNNAINVVSVGDVKLGTARTAIVQGFNPVISKFPVSMTLGTCGLYDSENPVLTGGQNDTEADLVYVLVNGQFIAYYYQVDQIGIFGSGWRKLGDFFADQSSVEIPSGAPVIVFRRSATPVEWVKMQPYVL